MTPEQKSREAIAHRLEQAGWIVQDMAKLNLMVGLGVAVREFPTSSGPVDYALFVDGVPVGVVEAKKDGSGENLLAVEHQSSRYARSVLKYRGGYRIRFSYEATGKVTHFTDYDDVNYRTRRVFSFHQPRELQRLLRQQEAHADRVIDTFRAFSREHHDEIRSGDRVQPALPGLPHGAVQAEGAVRKAEGAWHDHRASVGLLCHP